MDEGRSPQDCGEGEEEESSDLSLENWQDVAEETNSEIIRQLTQENEDLKRQCQNMKSEMSFIISEGEEKTNQILKLIDTHRAQQEQLEEEHQHTLDQFSQDLFERTIIIDDLQATIQDLMSKNEDLELQLEIATAFSEPPVDQPKAEDLTNTHVEFSVEEVEEEEERKAEPSLDVQTKSWWRRQKEKMVKGMATFRLLFQCSKGKRTSKRSVFNRSNKVHPINMDTE